MKRLKRLLIILYVSAALVLLSGCQHRNIFSSRRDMERLRPVQTIGLDLQEEGVVVSVSSGIGPENAPPLVMKCAASGIETAIERLQDYSPEDELFYAHVQYILLGETMAADTILPLLDWVERSPSMRTGTSIFIVKGNADTAITAATGEQTDITERLASLEREALVRGQHIYTLREVASSLAERSCALCLAVRAFPPDNTIYTETKQTAAIVPDGYAVLQNGAVAAYLSQNETLGAELLTGSAVGAQFTVDGNVLELFEGSAQASGQWDDDGTLTGIYVCGELKAGVRERERDGEEDLDTLQNDFRLSALRFLEDVIARSQELDCDFLNLEAAVMKNMPGHKASEPEDWADIFPTLPVTVVVEGEISRNYDLSD